MVAIVFIRKNQYFAQILQHTFSCLTGLLGHVAISKFKGIDWDSEYLALSASMRRDKSTGKVFWVSWASNIIIKLM